MNLASKETKGKLYNREGKPKAIFPSSANFTKSPEQSTLDRLVGRPPGGRFPPKLAWRPYWAPSSSILNIP